MHFNVDFPAPPRSSERGTHTAHIRQSRPDSGLGLHVKVMKTGQHLLPPVEERHALHVFRVGVQNQVSIKGLKIRFRRMMFGASGLMFGGGVLELWGWEFRVQNYTQDSGVLSFWVDHHFLGPPPSEK